MSTYTSPPPAPAERVPDISVIIAVYNAMPYLTECLESVAGQSLGLERIEVIAVDDGSTDGSGAELDRWAARHPQFRVVHQPNSGGPSVPRNRALDLARGRYVYVVDADDYIGPETLERLLRMADMQGSDVVLGKLVGLGRAVSDKAHRHAEQVDLYTSEVYRALHSAKLIRRQILERDRIRYPEDLWFGEDQLFVTAAFLAAGRISVVGDYDCYYLRRREDGQNITSRGRTAHETVEHIERVMRMVAERVTDPVGRRRMLGRHFRALLSKALRPAAWARRDYPEFAAEVYRRGRALCEAYWTPDMTGELTQIDAIRMYCFLGGAVEAFEQLAVYDPAKNPPEQLSEGGRLYRLFPYFRDPAVGLPDELYDVTDTVRAHHHLQAMAWKDGLVRLTGHAYLESAAPDGVTAGELLLRERATGRELSVPAAARPTPELAQEGAQRGVDLTRAGFRADLDLSRVDGGGPLQPGVWDAFLTVRAATGLERTVRLGRAHGPELDKTARRSRVLARDEAAGTELAVSPFFTAKFDNLSFEVVRRFAPPGE
ncbi:glycosyltransferase [Streptomyces sp. NRRL S-87]|uniref:glycosyltransferase n=1 Tax=Streptomyces sp. NRRL S-87 TaxID=1463920 RepID=UPI00068B9978|nr:glycosyltransferase [Streptomyces sp. NRRL S-87]